MTLPRDETPRLPFPSPSPHLGATRLASCHHRACSPVQRAWRASFLDHPGRTHPLGAHGSSPGSTGHAPQPVCQQSNADIAGDGRLLDFLAADTLVFWRARNGSPAQERPSL